jgi:hypothetical protein
LAKTIPAVLWGLQELLVQLLKRTSASSMDITEITIPPTCKVVLAATIAKSLLAEVKEGLSGLNKKLVLVGFLANEDPAARMYADWSAKTCIEKYVVRIGLLSKFAKLFIIGQLEAVFKIP